MKSKSTVLTVLILVGINLSLIEAQSALPTSGGDASGAGGSVSYTVGQVAYTPVSSPNGTANQGVQQPYEIFILATEEVTVFDCTVYPNPASDYLVLRLVNYPTHDVSYQLFDSHGRLLLANELQGTETSISTNNLPSATYFLSVLQHGKKVKSFKIIKN